MVMAHFELLEGMLASRITHKIVAAELQGMPTVSSHVGADCFGKLDRSPTFGARQDSVSGRVLG